MSTRLIITADSHTQGEPTRLVIAGVIHYPGDTMREKRAYVERELDPLRRSLMGEPRGHQDMFGGFITPPVTAEGDLGIVFMDNHGYLDMCGHGTIGLCTTVVELGLVQPNGARTEIGIDTPAGFVRGYALTENGHVVRAGFQNVPAFCLSTAETVEVDGFGELKVGIAYGGNFFAIIPATAVDVSLEIDQQPRLRDIGLRIKRAANEQLKVQHPLDPSVTGVDIVTFYGPAQQTDAAYRNVHVFADGQVDRSPGGTGTSAMLAYFQARAELEEDKVTIAEGLAGGLFEGRIVKTWDQDGQRYITPDISGRAFLIGIQSHYLNAADPMLYGLENGRS